MASDKITIDRGLFERLVEHAIDLAGEWHWKRSEPRKGYADVVQRLDADIEHAVTIRDALQETPQRIARHPMQPVVTDEYGTARFLRNAIVEHMVDSYPGGLNELACKGFGDEDWTQLAQLIGYSVEGFGDLSYVSDEAYQAAVDAESELRKSESLPRRMTDREREAWLAAGKYEVQLQAAAQRLREALGNPDIGSLDVVEAVDELIARHAKSIADIREAQRRIVEHIASSEWHWWMDVWLSADGNTYFAVDSPKPDTRGVTTKLDPSRCLLAQIAEAIDEWKRINLPATGPSE